jgi:hypothetical protein
MSPNGAITQYSKENVALMREQLLQSIKLSSNYAPAHYLLAVVNLVSGERLDEALEMAEKAHRLSPANKNYAELVDNIKQYRADNTTARREPIKSEAIAEPQRTTTSRMLGGESGPVAINDGRNVDSSGSLPTVEELVNRYVRAAGGEAAINAVTSRVVKGTIDVVGISRGGTFETYTVAPDKALSVMKPGPAETIKDRYNFYAILNLKNSYAKMTLRGKSKIGYREVYVMDLQPATGTADRMFMDAETYLPVRLNTSRVEGGVSVPVEIYFDDWREANGLKAPYTVTVSSGKRTMTLSVKEIQYNIPVDAKIFEKP